MVENVESLEAHLNLTSLTQFSDRISFDDAAIEIHRADTVKDVAAGVAVVILRGSRERPKIDPIVDTGLKSRRAAGGVPIGTRLAGIGGAHTHCHSERMAVANRGDAVHLPVADQTHEPGVGYPASLDAPKRQRIGIAQPQQLRNAGRRRRALPTA